MTQQEGAFKVTVSLKKGAVNGLTGAQPDTTLDVPLTVDLSASLEPPGNGPAEAASPIFAPVQESVTFPPGASTETVTVPIVSSVATPGEAIIYLSASTASSLGIPSGNQMVELYSSPDAVPPTITSVQPVTQGKLASAVVIGFSKPMAPATVENIQNYRILSRPKITSHGGAFGGLFGGRSTTRDYRSFPIAAATYDPSTWTVTLTLKRPARASSLYLVSSAYPIEGHELTDPQGQAVDQGHLLPGIWFPTPGFNLLVHPNPRSTPAPVGRLKTTIHSPGGLEALDPLRGFA